MTPGGCLHRLNIRSLRAVALMVCTVLPWAAFATHLRAGEITVKRENCASLIYKVTVTVYTNTGSSVNFGGEGEVIDFGDGTVYPVPEIEETPRPDLGEGIGTASITVSHPFPGPGTYKISWREPNRNEGVLNMSNSVNTTFYIETQLTIDPFKGCNDSAVLLVAPIDHGCVGVAFFHNPGAYDPNGDSLSYELAVPFSDNARPVNGYLPPNDPFFYTALEYGIANEDHSHPPTFTIDPVSGTIKWDAPGTQGEYNIAFIIREWRKTGSGKAEQIGYVRRDMQIIIEDCDNNRPDLIVPEDTCVVAGTTLEATIFGTDPDGDSVKIEAFSEVLSNLHATYTPSGTTYQPSAPPAELHFKWDVKCDHVKEQRYQVVFKITDNPPAGPKLVTFKSWTIKVVGPAPVWTDAKVNLAKRFANLEWEPYACVNANKIQVWRKVDGASYVPGTCDTGMPDFLGYTKIAELNAADGGGNPVVNYTDTNGGKGLDVGAKYCYRLVAVFPLPEGGESYVSKDTCLAPILADEPVITHVTVDKTGFDDGEITVSWRSPFDIDPVQYPGPYTYKVLRAQGFASNFNLGVVSGTGELSDTTFTDTGLNTEETIYNYRVILYSNTADDPLVWSPIDTSSVASTVRLEAKSQNKEIALSWSAVVPWSNRSERFPFHLVYRGPENATEAELILIDKVNVLTSAFMYSDHGQFDGDSLDENKEYCYRVLTRGTYGNPAIDEPQENYSQIICSRPSDDIPPCKPILHVQIQDCEDFLSKSNCNQSIFSNVIFWDRPKDEACRADIRSYNIYVANSADGEFVLLAEDWRDTVYVDENLPSFARCYSISAVDRSGNESELSNPVCNDNCPYYELPNVFTPNGDDCNDLFSAFGNPRFEGGEEGVLCPPLTVSNGKVRCARFVEKVRMKIYNRWGKEVFDFTSGEGEGTIYVEWDGRDANGRELASGIYYYSADVTFDMADPVQRRQNIKGWVHLVR